MSFCRLGVLAIVVVGLLASSTATATNPNSERSRHNRRVEAHVQRLGRINRQGHANPNAGSSSPKWDMSWLDEMRRKEKAEKDRKIWSHRAWQCRTLLQAARHATKKTGGENKDPRAWRSHMRHRYR